MELEGEVVLRKVIERIRHLTMKFCAKWQKFGFGLSMLGRLERTGWRCVGKSGICLAAEISKKINGAMNGCFFTLLFLV